MRNNLAKSLDKRTQFRLSVIGVLILALAWKVLLLAKDAFPFNSDEAIVGLMARHILSGSRPIFFYGQAYMGSLDAFLAAVAFRLLGLEVYAIRIVQTLLYLGVVLTTILIAYAVRKDRVAAILSGLLLAIPTVNVTLYTTISLGGYGEALLIGNFLILLTLRIEEKPASSMLYGVWGFLAGLGFWAFGLTLIYSIPCGLFLHRFLHRSERYALHTILPLLGGLVLGLLPIWIWVVENGLNDLVAELFGSAIAGSSADTYLQSVGLHLQNLFLFGPTVIFGLRAPWSTTPLSIGLLPLALCFWALALLHAVIRRGTEQDRRVYRLVGWMSLLLIIGLVFTPFGADPSGRYFLPLMIPLALLGGEVVRSPAIKIPGRGLWLLYIGTLLFQFHSTWQTANQYPHRITSQFDAVARVDQRELSSLLQFLDSEGEIRGYTNYWVAYPLAFHSDEQVVFYPALPYHQDFRYSERDNRYQPYKELVEASEQVALITTNHEALNMSLRLSFDELGLEWEEREIGDFHIFYDLSRRVEIIEVGERWLGW